ncbi:DUF397 domain-containing protein [Kitasatospora viridis]|uniref:Uncharacterized protein DUF397 n=1 Tax=Kitasatospora viridis TaxID=281105 RepID=A0A561SFM1_9ACTN|nr:DUF397 domain-containing protein [Kitasatospora viridis]TWF73662.1 uncharacterized protein DUF397 [Kitasatospora viridis]
MTAPDLPHGRWFKSSFSGTETNCVEVADGFAGIIPVRDSKDPSGGALVFPAKSWATFVAGLKAGEFGAS